MTNLKLTLAMELATATLLVALLFFAGSVLLLQSWFATLVAQAGFALESFAAVFTISAIMLSTGAFIISWKQRSFLVAVLLAISGVIVMIHPLTSIFMMNIQMVTVHSAVIVVSGPILVAVSGLGMLGLGVAKGIRTARM